MRSNFGLKLQNIKITRNCLTYMLDFIVMQMSKVNREKGHWKVFDTLDRHSIDTQWSTPQLTLHHFSKQLTFATMDSPPAC